MTTKYISGSPHLRSILKDVDKCRLQNGWVFGKAPKRGRGAFSVQKCCRFRTFKCGFLGMKFWKKLQHDFPKMRGGGQRPFGIFPKIDPFWWRHLSLTTLTQHLSNHNLFAQVSMAATWAQHLTKAKVGVEEVKTNIFHRWDAIFLLNQIKLQNPGIYHFFLNRIKQWKPEICDGYLIASQKRETLY